MNRNKRIILILAVAVMVLTVILPLQTGLGFGDFDSGSDSGGSDSGGYDSGGSDWGGSYDSGSGSGGRLSGSFGGMLFVLALTFLTATAVSGVKDHRKKRQNEAREEQARARKQARIDDYLKHDPGFDQEKLIRWCRKLFTEMQEAWEKGDITPVQYGFHPDTWNRFNTQLQMKNERGETTHVRDIRFIETSLTDYTHTGPNEKLTVRILAEYNVWVTDRDGRNIQGTPATRHRMDYRWVLQRPYDAVTSAAERDRMHCPHCGAELDLAAFAECPFCKAQISSDEKEWLLADITLNSQKTV